LGVVLDYGAILEEERAKKRALGLQIPSEELVQQSNRQFKALVDEVFPNGQMGGISVIRSSTTLPILTVSVPNREALKRLMNHPKVIRVYEEPSVEIFIGNVKFEKNPE
jgi:hypothetical protein